MATPQTEPLRLSTNCIINGQFVVAGDPLPVAAEDLPETLKPLVMTGEPEPEEENTPRGSFETGVVYELTSDGRLGRAVRRQAAELEAENEREEWLEQEPTLSCPPR